MPHVLRMCRPDHIPTIFSPNCLRCLTSSLSREDSQLKPLAQKCIKGLAAYLDEAPDKGLRVAAVVALQRHGGVGFDRLAGTPLSARLLHVGFIPASFCPGLKCLKTCEMQPSFCLWQSVVILS